MSFITSRPPVAALAGQEGEGFARLAQQIRTPLLRYFSRRTGSSADAEELLQDLFVRLLRRPGLLALENVEGYVFEAAANLLRDKARRDRNRAAMEIESGASVDAPAEAPGAEQVVGDRQSLERMKAALKSLPPRARTIVILRRFEDLSHAEIAARLKISVSAVEKHMARAMLSLRDAMKDAEA